MRALVFATFVFSAFPLMASGPARAAEPAACNPSFVAQIYRSGDLARLTKAYADTDDCRSAEPRYCVARLVATVYADQARKTAAAGAPASKVAATIEDAFHKYGKPWRLYAAKGDLEIARSRKESDQTALSQAALDYESAINDLAEDDGKCVPYGEEKDVDPNEIARLHQRMVEAKLLAPAFELIKTRDGECGGVFLTQVRDIKVKSTPLPIHFEYNSTALAPEGEQALKALSTCVGGRHFKSIHLTGHTDMKGSDAFNMDLSARRLKVIERALKAGGFQGAIALEPKGKSEPLELDDPGQYTQPQIDQLNRRVELRDAAE